MCSQSYGFSSSHVWMWELDYKASWAPKNWCFWTVTMEKTLVGPLYCKEIQPVHPKGDQSLGVHWNDWCWSWNCNTLATSCEELTHWKRPWCWERLKAGVEGDDIGWDGWMASATRWSLSKLWGLVMGREARRAAVHGVTKSQIRLNNCTVIYDLDWHNEMSILPEFVPQI